MLISTILSGGCTMSGSPPPDHQRLTREAQVRAKAEARGAEEIPCPGGCGGTAWLEHSPVLITRDGHQRTVRVATCAHTCRTETRVGRQREAHLRPTRFEIPTTEEMTAVPTPKKIYLDDAERKLVQDAIEKCGVLAPRVAQLNGLRESSLRRWLREGHGLSASRVAPAVEWARQVLADEWHPAPEDLPNNRSKARRTVWKEQRKVSPGERHANYRESFPAEERWRMREAILQAGLTQAQVATEIGAVDSCLSAFLRKGKGISKDKIEKLVEFVHRLGTYGKTPASHTVKGRVSPGEPCGHNPPTPECPTGLDCGPLLSDPPRVDGRKVETPEKAEARKRAWETRRQNGRNGKMGPYRKFDPQPTMTLHVDTLTDAEVAKLEAETKPAHSQGCTCIDCEHQRYLLRTVVTDEPRVMGPTATLAEAMPMPTPTPRVADVLLAGVTADLETIATEHLARLSPTVAKRVRVRVVLEEVA